MHTGEREPGDAREHYDQWRAHDGVGRNSGKPDFKGFSLSLDAKSEADATRMFNALSDGGQVIMPLGNTFFSPCFGMLADKFGVHWMIIVEQ